jgi:hypothetical protein
MPWPAPGPWPTRATVAILVLTVASTASGLLVPGYHGHSETLARVRAEDVAILAVGVPAMAASLTCARRGSSPGLVVWLGSLAFSGYVWSSRVVQLSFNPSFFPHLLLSSLSVFTLAACLGSIDAGTMRTRLENRINTRAFAVALYFLAAGLSFLWLSDIVPAAIAGTTPPVITEFGPQGMATVAIDLGIVVPAMVLTGVLLDRKRPVGYLAAGVVLVFGALLGPGLLAITLVDYHSGVTLTAGIVLGTTLPPVVSTLFALRFLSALRRAPGPAA